MPSNVYLLDKRRRRVLAGLTPEETTEFELLDAGFALDAKPVFQSGAALGPSEQRWLELYGKMQAALTGSTAA